MSNDAGASNFPLPPECMTTDDPSAVIEARLRLMRKSSLLSLPLFKKARTKRPANVAYSASSSTTSLPTCTDSLHEETSSRMLEIDDRFLDVPVLEEEYDKDVYRWAIMYENQRGCVLRLL